MRRKVSLVVLPLVLACEGREAKAPEPGLPTAPALAVGDDATIGRVTYLPTPPGVANVEAVAINAIGWIVGSGVDNAGCTRIVLWSPRGSVEVLPPCATPVDINGRNLVTGNVTVAGAQRAFLWTPGKGLLDLGSLNGTWSRAAAINDSGWVVGASGQFGVSQTGFVYIPGQGMRDLSALAGTATIEARAVNQRGEVLADERGPPLASIVWHPVTGVRQLPPYQAGLFNPGRAFDLNDSGEAAGYGPYDPFNDLRTLKWPAAGAPQLLRVWMRCMGWTYGQRVAKDGSVLGARYDCLDSRDVPYLWTSTHGTRFLTDYLRCTARDLSPSGKRAVGNCPSGPITWDF